VTSKLERDVRHLLHCGAVATKLSRNQNGEQRRLPQGIERLRGKSGFLVDVVGCRSGNVDRNALRLARQLDS
jgi:hypothetical protein